MYTESFIDRDFSELQDKINSELKKIGETGQSWSSYDENPYDDSDEREGEWNVIELDSYEMNDFDAAYDVVRKLLDRSSFKYEEH